MADQGGSAAPPSAVPSTLLSPGGDPPPGGDNCAYPEPVEGGRAIHYSYDGLGRLVEAAYGTGICYQYRYDQVGNRETMTTTTTLGSTSAVTYTYDTANRLTHVGGITLTWDNRGNLLEDQEGTVYAYDVANRLAGVVQNGITYTFSYNGLGDRLKQTVITEVTTYTLDLYAGLTQVLDDGTNLYLYPSASSGLGGLGRIGEEQTGGWAYHLSDALGSVRQLADEDGWVTLVQSFKPYGDVLSSDGDGESGYGYSGEWADGTGLVFLRARYMDPTIGRFLTRDTWDGSVIRPETLHKYGYVGGNPLTFTDPAGFGYCDEAGNCRNLPPELMREHFLESVRARYQIWALEWQEMYRQDYPTTSHSPATNPADLNISEQGVQFIAQFEGVRLQLYNDAAGHCTCCIGHLVHTGVCNLLETLVIDGVECNFEYGVADTITPEQASALFRSDLGKYVQAVQNGVSSSISQEQFDALVSVTYNVGPGAFDSRSPLRAAVNEGDNAAVVTILRSWNMAKNPKYGISLPLEGLARRRELEISLFLYGVYGKF